NSSRTKIINNAIVGLISDQQGAEKKGVFKARQNPNIVTGNQSTVQASIIGEVFNYFHCEVVSNPFGWAAADMRARRSARLGGFESNGSVLRNAPAFRSMKNNTVRIGQATDGQDEPIRMRGRHVR